ncbi:MAG: hypothetical protein JRE23_16255 [Deltaproteobacteria bacterium]|nr:hypothetical protein [Deltaproteobacteria bacterium]
MASVNAQFDPINLSKPITAVKLSQSDSTYLEEYRFLPDSVKVGKAWRHICGRNSYELDSLDIVLPGYQILLPLGFTPLVAKAGGSDHLWSAAEYYVDTYVDPYLNGTLPIVPWESDSVIPDDSTATATTINSSETPWWHWLIVGLVILWIVLFVLYLNRDKKRTDDSSKRALAELDRSRKFVPDPPVFKISSTEEANRNAESAAQSVFGRNVEIVGDIERGYISGEQVIFNADGTSSRETFTNEPGYRARVKFPNGNERVVVCRWACFNPCYSSVDAEFTGTFRPEGSKNAEEIPAITKDQTTAVEQSIQGGDKELTAEDIPGSDVDETTESDKEATDVFQPKEDGKLNFTSLRVSEKGGLTAEGDFKLSTDELFKILFQITGRHADDLNKD